MFRSVNSLVKDAWSRWQKSKEQITLFVASDKSVALAGWLILPTMAIWFLAPPWAAQGAVYSYLGSYFTLLIVRHSRAKSFRVRVFAIVAMYLEIMVVFGLCYQTLFHYAPEDAFVFSGSIREGKAHQVFLNHYRQVLQLNDSLYLLSVVDSHAMRSLEIKRAAHFGKPFPILDSDYKELSKGYSLAFSGGCDEHAICEWIMGIRGLGKEVHIGGADGPDSVDENARHTDAVKTVCTAESFEDFIYAERQLQSEIVSERESRISQLRQNVNGQTDWDYVDFLYFSAMTMTTVGYGDILPSSRATRLVVLGHAVLGIFYVGFALSFIWPKSSKS